MLPHFYSKVLATTFALFIINVTDFFLQCIFILYYTFLFDTLNEVQVDSQLFMTRFYAYLDFLGFFGLTNGKPVRIYIFMQFCLVMEVAQN